MIFKMGIVRIQFLVLKYSSWRSISYYAKDADGEGDVQSLVERAERHWRGSNATKVGGIFKQVQRLQWDSSATAITIYNLLRINEISSKLRAFAPPLESIII